MTALKEYQRLEAAALWRAGKDDQRRDVVVSLGDATLVISDLNDRALAHWSLAAVERLNPGEAPALYAPDGLPGETLEVDAGETEMIAAIERIRRAIQARRPRRGRLRAVITLLTVAAVAAAGVLWLPDALRQQALTVVPDVKRQEIGEALLDHIKRVSGPPCGDVQGRTVLTRLAERLPGIDGAPRLVVLRAGVRDAAHLPGNIILLNRAVVEDTEEPDVVAGYIIVEELRARAEDPLAQLLDHAGVAATFRLLTTGSLPDERLAAYAEALLTESPRHLPRETVLAGFRAWSVRSSPYAYARDVSGESVLPLIEADPYADAASDPVMNDADWLRLQAICSG